MSEAATWAYSPKQITISINGALIDGGFGEDTFLSIERQEDDTVDTVGVDGSVAVSRVHDDRATVELTLLATSDANDVLSALRAAGRGTPIGVAIGPFFVEDRLGRTVHRARHCWIQKPPTTTFARGVSEKVWMFRLANHEAFDGGNIQL